MKLRSLPLHPFIVAAFQILTVYSINVNEAHLSSVILALFSALLFTVLLFLSASFITADKRLSAVLVTFYVFLFFAYGRILDILIGYPVLGLPLGRNRYFIPLYVFIAVAGTLWAFRSKWCKKNLGEITYYLNILSIVLIMSAVLTAAINFDWTTLGGNENAQSKSHTAGKEVHQITKKSENTSKPNVYFLIFDSYVNHRVMKKYYGWDNSGLVNALIERGFSVNNEARSNYCFTGGSIGSTLSMRYFHEDEGFRKAYNQASYLGQFYDHNEVMERFKSEGYDVLSNQGNHRRINEKIEKSLLPDDFLQLVIHISILRTLEKELITDNLRQDILSMLEGLKQFEKPNKPVFIYLHYEIPHEPFIFNADGSRPKYFESAFGKFEDKVKYVEQAKFAETQIIEIVDILKQRDPTAVIIVQADHGYGGRLDDIYLDRNSLAAGSEDHKKPPTEYIDQRFGILSAIHLPPGIVIPEKITPVNLFRYLFNGLFDAKLEILPDKAFFTVIKQPYYFHDVTNDLKHAEQSGN